ncbi:MAG: hypothetical protein BWY52_03057 [Chloroflexi bacterium ADurb.Bin325]|nr:MAG: hypothetical protein BWY52_03057 [Chloroflexi bacterium ADurb.Bin325]
MFGHARLAEDLLQVARAARQRGPDDHAEHQKGQQQGRQQERPRQRGQECARRARGPGPPRQRAERQREQEAAGRDQERAEHQEELAEAAGEEQVGPKPAELRLEADVEREIQQPAQRGQDDPAEQRAAENGRAQPLAQRERRAERQRRQPDVDREVPRIEEAQRAQRQRVQRHPRRAQARRLAQRLPPPQSRQLPASGFQLPASGFRLPAQQVRGQPHRQERKRQRQHVRVQVAQDETERGKLVDQLDRVADQILVVDDARRAPPPPEPAGPAAGRRGVGQSLYVKPLDEREGQQPALVRGVEQPFEVAEKAHAQRGQHPPADAVAAGRRPARISRRGDEHLRHAERAQHHERIPQRHAHVEPDGRIHPAQPDEQAEHDVAEVVVADGVAGEPGVLRREEAAVQHAVDEGELHRLFRAGDVGIICAEGRPSDQHGRKQRLGRDDQPPVGPQPRQQGPPPRRVPLPACAADRPRDARDDHKAGQDAPQVIRDDMEDRADPQDVGHEQQPERLRKRVAPAAEPREQPPGQRQGRKAERLDDQPPGNHRKHGRILQR